MNVYPQNVVDMWIKQAQEEPESEERMDFGIASVAAITVIAYLVGQACKASEKVNDSWIPVICGCVGAVLGVVGFKVMPDFPATDAVTAVAVGIVSGFAATGINQIYKQLGETTERG